MLMWKVDDGLGVRGVDDAGGVVWLQRFLGSGAMDAFCSSECPMRLVHCKTRHPSRRPYHMAASLTPPRLPAPPYCFRSS